MKKITQRGLFSVAAAAIAWPMMAKAADLKPLVISIDQARDRGLVAAAYQGGQVVIWDIASGAVRSVFNAAGLGATRNKPLAHFSADGRRLAFTAEGDAGLIVFDLDKGSSTVVVPRRLLYRGITAFSWSRQSDTMLVAIGRDIVLFDATGHLHWQRRLETRAIIKDVVWHPSEKFYTVATDDATVSSYETISGRVIASAVIDSGNRSAPVKVRWSSDGSALVACIQGGILALLDLETLKPSKLIPCNCTDFDWSPSSKELAASIPPNIAVFTESGQRSREIRTPFDGGSPVLWADPGHIFAASSDSTVVLRDARSPKIIKTFMFPGNAKIQSAAGR